MLAAGCAGGPQLAPVTPADIPALEAQARQDPGSARTRFRLAAAYLSADRCTEAAQQAGAGLQIEPDNVLGPLVVGACQERDQRYDLAVETYTVFADRHGRARGVAALRARAQQALRAGAGLAARQAVAREADLTALPPEPGTLAILPLTIAGDSAYRSLSRGLAELITTDLAVVRSLRLLERMHVGALLEELQLAQEGRVDPATAGRMGRLLRAERLVQGVASIASEREPVRLQLTVVAGDGTVRAGPEAGGRFRDLLDLEKRIVLGLGPTLGIEITEAERRRILAQGPKNLAAFLAYSLGIEALDRGDYSGAARHFREAQRADPGFTAARNGEQAAVAAPAAAQTDVQSVVNAADGLERVLGSAEPAPDRAMTSTSIDVAPTLGDAVIRPSDGGTGGTGTTDRQVTIESTGISSVQGTSTIIRIIFKRPL